MTTLATLNPSKKYRVMDLVAQAGHDISDWAESSSDPSQAAANPKYCYEWAFQQRGKPVILSLWHYQMKETAGEITLTDSMLELVKQLDGQPKRSMGRLRASRFDHVLKSIWAEDLPIRVIVNGGRPSDMEDPGAPSSIVEQRELDPVPWALRTYDPVTGYYTLVRGGTPGKAVDHPHIDPYLFEQHFKAFSAYVASKDGASFLSFASSSYLDAEEGYKYKVHASARALLNLGTWKPSTLGSGQIARAVISAIELPDSNLVPWQARYGEEQRPHQDLYRALEDPGLLMPLEGALYKLYRHEDDEASFEDLVAILGRKYSLHAYLMFLKDRAQYLPIATRSFDRAFVILGAEFKTEQRCSWENYRSFCRLIGEIKELLAENMAGEVTLLDAHSFAWMLARQMQEEGEPQEVKEYLALDSTEREAIVQARVGQGKFRHALLAYWKRCAVTGLGNESLLVASHIRPWKSSTVTERLGLYNGLLLSPTLDACFDRGLISFGDDGCILISEKLIPADAAALGISVEMRLDRIEDGHRQQLSYHRANIFK